MAQKKSAPGLSKLDPRNSRDLLLDVAKKMFAERGFDGVSVKDLADGAGVNVSLVSYYFHGKEGLYNACLESFSAAGLETAERALKPPRSRDEFQTRLQIFIEEFLRLHIQEENICKIIHRDFANPNSAAFESFKKNFQVTWQRLHEFIQAAQKEGIVDRTFDIEVGVGLIFGGLLQLIRMHTAREKLAIRSVLEPKRFEKTIDQIVRYIACGILTRGDS